MVLLLQDCGRCMVWRAAVHPASRKMDTIAILEQRRRVPYMQHGLVYAASWCVDHICEAHMLRAFRLGGCSQTGTDCNLACRGPRGKRRGYPQQTSSKACSPSGGRRGWRQLAWPPNAGCRRLAALQLLLCLCWLPLSWPFSYVFFLFHSLVHSQDEWRVRPQHSLLLDLAGLDFCRLGDRRR